MLDPTPWIGQEIRRIRTEQKLTLDEAATLSGVSKAMLGQIERANPIQRSPPCGRSPAAFGYRCHHFCPTVKTNTRS